MTKRGLLAWIVGVALLAAPTASAENTVQGATGPMDDRLLGEVCACAYLGE